MNLRERRRAETRQSIQRHAIRLFVGRGYEVTTVNDVALAAGVSAMTVYRHFATKEDLVLYDQFDQLAAATVAELPADVSLVVRIARTLASTYDQAIADKEFHLARLRLMISTPALRARHLDSQYSTQEALVSRALRRIGRPRAGVSGPRRRERLPRGASTSPYSAGPRRTAAPICAGCSKKPSRRPSANTF